MKAKEAKALSEEMFEHLEKAYYIAGDLRDGFSPIKDDAMRRYLKEACNKIRQNISECRQPHGLYYNSIKLTLK